MSALLVSGLDLFAWFVPNDPRLAALAPLCRAVRDKDLALAGVLRALGGAIDATAPASAEILRYVPESRACARFGLPSADGIPPRSIFAKIERAQRGAVTDAIMRALSASPAQAAGRLRTPRSLLWQAAAGVHWLEGVPGSALAERHRLCPPSLGAQVGDLLAALHTTAVPQAPELTDEALLGAPCEVAALLGAVEPAWAGALARLCARLADCGAAALALPRDTLHGDLHPRNVLVDGDRLALIDFDDVCRGPGVLELGSWVADLLQRALLGEAPMADAQETAARTVAAYGRGRDGEWGAQLLGWATARALLCDQARRSVTGLRPGRYARIPAVLAMADLVARHGVTDRPLPNF